MKKNLLLAVAMLIGVVSFAQNKGDMFVSGNFSIDCGTYTTSTSLDGYSSSKKSNFDTSITLGADFGYFIADNVRLGLTLWAPFTSSPIDEVDGKTLKSKSAILEITPNVAYYIKLADRFYYTPELGASLSWGKIKNDISLTETESTPVSTWGIYTNLVSFEYKVSDRFSIGSVIGGLGWYSSIYKYPDAKYKMNQFICSFSDAAMLFRWYF